MNEASPSTERISPVRKVSERLDPPKMCLCVDMCVSVCITHDLASLVLIGGTNTHISTYTERISRASYF